MNSEFDRMLAGISRRTMFGLAAATAGSVALAACGRSDDKAPESSTTPAPSPTVPSDEPQAIASDAYVFGYPLVLMDATRAAFGNTTPINQFQHSSTLPTPDRRDVVRLNLDTLYSIAWLDLTAEPLVLQVPAVEGDRYWIMQVLDAWTNTAHDPGSVRPQVKSDSTAPPYTYAITGPGWQGELPEEVTQLSMPTAMAWLLGRIQVNGSDDISNVQAIQQQMKLVPLGDWIAGRPAPKAATVPADTSVPPARQVALMNATTFYNRLCALMVVNPPAADDAPAMARFAKIGIAPGGAVRDISTDDLTAAAAAAQKQIPTYKDPGLKVENGWEFATDLGAYGTNYALRALVATQGLGANLARDALYPTIFGDADTDGTPNRYRLRFASGQTPPVDAFWSITAYDDDSYLVSNTAGIYAVGHQVPPVRNSDGSVDIAVQHDDPGAGVPQSNWLPIPASGSFSLTMRLYSPKESVLNGRWLPPALTPVS